MTIPSEDAFARIEHERDRSSSRPLGDLRRAEGERRLEGFEVWLTAGETLAEKAIAAIDTGDEERAERLARRIIALPVIDESTPSGLMAVSVLLMNEIVDPSFEGGEGRGFLDLPLRLLPTLDEPAADALRYALAAITAYELPAAVRDRIRAVTLPERRFDPPFAGVSDEQLPAAVIAALRLVLRLRAED
ncbi:hypothetical protein [Amnibacterium kyonggiense]|uniref:Uncharacterized protein n=1 Tax=Amnibacterium kyonggiense TaxID=595671 RepID=A0A4R7FLH5_9MICO|nr:hypothetical protein [Amnibacterium kyonggiense]TDS77260.1 hypothetical protein CLV52_2203 [Amnibacterium kyonggiense]